MRPIHIFVLGGGLLILTAIIYWYQTASEATSEPQAQVAVIEPALLTPLSADVEMSMSLDSASWTVVTTAGEIIDDTRVRTSPVGRAVIASNQEILTSIHSNSEIHFKRSDDSKQTRVELLAGQTWSKIMRALELDETYEVYTPTIVAAVRGTAFGANTDPMRSLVVTEGVVRVELRDPQTGDSVPETSIDVTAGNTVESGDGRLLIRPTTEADRDDWYVINNPQATKEQEAESDSPAMTTSTMDSTAETSLPRTPAPVVSPEPQPIPEPIPVPTQTTPPVRNITITNVNPSRLTYDDKIIIRFTGTDLEMVTRVEFNGDEVEFDVTRTGVLIVAVSNLPNRDETYDVVLYTGDTRLSLPEAVVIQESIEEILLRIENVLAGEETSTSAQTFYVRVLGTGMDTVDTVLINNQAMEFVIVNSTELRVFNVMSDSGMTIEVRAGNLSDRLTI